MLFKKKKKANNFKIDKSKLLLILAGLWFWKKRNKKC